MKYRVGDKVKIIGCTCSTGRFRKKCPYSSEHQRLIGLVSTITYTNHSGRWPYSLKDGGAWKFEEVVLKLVKRRRFEVRKAYKLLKDTPEYKKGAVFKEACDDGDQGYCLVDHTFLSTNAAADKGFEYGDETEVLPKKVVEKSPSWFERVYPAGEIFFTEKELAAFKKWQKGKK